MVIGRTFFNELKVAGLGTLELAWNEDGLVDTSNLTADQLKAVEAVLAAHNPNALLVPDCGSLPWWRTALKLWMRTDANGNAVSRYADIDAAIKSLETASDVQSQRLGILAREQFEYANSVQRDDLLKLAPAFQFSPADVDESLWRADQIRKGDLSGTWPTTA